MTKKKSVSRSVWKAAGFRSGFEYEIDQQLKERKVDYSYESITVTFEATIVGKYKPDFILSSGILLEAKGYFKLESRKRLKLIKLARPDLDIRLVFQNPNVKCGKRMRYCDWADKYRFPWCGPVIPEAWLR